ncbi:MAG TPA: DUF1810 domain-containing protein, partial [Candidatus Limnocylindrales bacterium]|nr:DUF1810 domain-containing protein [Candidatus Limnocylindrales bacterium]
TLGDVSFDLQRFSDAQAGVYEQALVELRAGRKQSHWMWFIFPQLRGLGRSETSRFYGLDGLAEARAYLADPVLGPRLRQSFEAVVAAPGTAEAILGAIDAMKLRSSATVFARASPDDSLFRVVLARFFDGRPDPATDALLGGSQADSQADT